MIDQQVNRRRLIQAAGVVIAVSTAGCDYPRHRDLTFSGVNVTEGSEDEYITEVTPKKSSSDDTDQWQTFHNVTVIGYAESGAEVCREELGDIPSSEVGRLETVRMTCSEFPVLITYSAEESPCDSDTEIGVAVFRTGSEGESFWKLDEKRQCGEGLPPEHLD